MLVRRVGGTEGSAGMAVHVTHPAELAELDLYAAWTEAPELKSSFDPFDFDQRMSVYRHLIDATNAKGLFGPDNRGNLLWGLMFQLQWQSRTGRLGATGRGIDPDAAWGYGNYSLSVVPWLGAVDAGLVADLELIGPSAPCRFDYARGERADRIVTPEFIAGVRDWREYFRSVMETEPGSDDEPLRLALWKAHKTGLDAVAGRIADIDPGSYSTDELTFLRGWCRMVDYLWAAAWHTDFDFMVTHGLDVLPERLLHDNDNLKDLPDTVRRNVANVRKLADTPNWRYAIDLGLWRRMMRTRPARDEVLTMLDVVFNPPATTGADRLRALRYLLRP
ncbi:Leg1-related protein [Nocardia seriolae]|uniref:Leg1-related protein n=2 Tax=Nocardia seriolae TaxID=37332 RepID=UPI001E5AA794|nr:Leg1-related protein [Nocardia seriolae]WKY53503.1 Leg1-related protein [Nocardia seriolae]BEK85255.1 hypothetical protein NSERKGN1266_12060 [Nocardia seriolae]